jgi:phosphoglucosamine mutase
MGRLFGTSGIRGVVNEDLTPELFLEMGLVLATKLGNSGTVVVGRDPRTSSEMLENALVSGLISGGCNVKRLGVVPTPVVSFAVRLFGASAGAMITASHNPPEYNGLKFWDEKGMAYSPTLEAEVEELYFKRMAKPVAWDEMGSAEEVDVLPRYLEAIARSVSLKKGYTVVVDCGNGAGAVVTPHLLRRLGCKVITINSQLDGYFPGRGLEPTPENLRDLCHVVSSVGADIGLAHDGDADRIAAVDERGRVVEPDKLLALISAHQVKKRGDIVVTTVDASSLVDESVKARGGELVRTRVGDVSVANEVKKRGAVFGGEPSGAWIFPHVHLAPDGPLAAAKIVELLGSTGKALSELLDELPTYPTLREKIACPNEKKAAAVEKFGALAMGKFKDVMDVLTIDGIRLSLRDGSWLLVRPSGTEPYIRITAEGKTLKRAKEMTNLAVEILKKIIGHKARSRSL